jgi:hypothetical protein
MAYGALELGTPGAPACPNAPNEEAMILCPECDRLLIFVANNPIYLQLGYMQHGRGISAAAVDWQPPKPMQPCAASLYRHFDAVRVYNFTKGSLAEVLLSVDFR